MKKIKISIIFEPGYNEASIKKLLSFDSDEFECFVSKEQAKVLERTSKKLHIIPTEKNSSIYDIIKHINGEYVLILSKFDILPPNSILDLLHIIELTNTDIIKLKPGVSYDNDSKLAKFRYVFNKNEIMNYCFDELSQFCFKTKLFHNNQISKHVFLMNILLNANDMAISEKTCILSNNNNYYSTQDFIDIVNNYNIIKNKLSNEFWKKYFYNIMPKLVMTSTKDNDQSTFLYFIKNIPMRFIPLRYRIICYIFKKTSK